MMPSLREKVGQMMMVGFDGLRAPRHILQWLESGRIGGIYLFARNVRSPAQVARLITDCRRAAKVPILVGIDQEGGAVARLREGFTESPGAMALGASGDPKLAEDIAYMMGLELAALGVNWNFAPVADLAHQSDNPSVGTRAVGRAPQLVSDFVSAQIRGFQRAGVAATVKHFPGLGNSVIDTHDAMATVSAPLSSPYAEDLMPFRAAIAAGVSSVMLTHVVYEALDSGRPATLSQRIATGLLREELAYDGAVCTDCMEMKAITDRYGAGESAVLAVDAGLDLIMFSHSREAQEAAYEAVLEAVGRGRLSQERVDQSVARIQALERQYSLDHRPALEIVGSSAHLARADEAARAGIVLVKRGNALPLDSSLKRPVLIEFRDEPNAEAADPQTRTWLASYLSSRLPAIRCQIVDPRFSEAESQEIESLLPAADVIILVTRNAHLRPRQMQLTQLICDSAGQVLLLCARNPYDAGRLRRADTIICSNGDSRPSLKATVDALFGDYLPAGKLTVAI